MATISNITACGGGNHITGTITMSGGGSHTFHATLAELRAAADEVDRRTFIMRQVASIARANPGDTLVQLRNRLQAATFLE